ncbi:MAG TPA: tetratricopeptide repeat protein [Oligoflexus sp.]|uniref:tetratricopeptide repeat protein n=1 Tax=Oligoflexus sp. TaxID=1971216 RepID=UPI002D810036|nr:tetratricopeptide repeat protein [Oligoflexus sp.]HET9236394.1 tetratricopeptide repeat protein [Oligoflexus sp.]
MLTFSLSLLLIIFLPVSASGKTPVYKQGLQHYAKGEFDKAVQSLQNALKKKPSKAEKVKIYKYIGLSLYTLGRQAEAEKNFEQCLATDSACSIEAKEALDESVLPFFQNIKRGVNERKNAPKPKTRILVKTPIKDAEILMDGILLGPANASLDANPGTREITLQAKGYRPRRVKIAVNKNVENVYEISLDKLPPKVDAKALEREKEKERERERDKAKQQKIAREKAKEKERDRERAARKLEARKEKEKKEKEKEKVPPVLPNEDESAKKLADPGPEPKKESLEMPEEKGPPVTAAASSPADVPAELEREPVSIAHFLPLGVGQFYNGDYLLGTLFLTTQLYAGAVIVQANQDIQQAEDNEQAAIRRAQVDPTVTPDDLLAFSQAKQAFVKDKQERLNLALGAAAGTYVFGVVHALIMRPYVLPAAVSMQLMPTGNQGLELQVHWDF